MSILARLYIGFFFLLYFGHTQRDSIAYLLRKIWGQSAPQLPWVYAFVLTAVLMFLAKRLMHVCNRHGVHAFIPYIGAAWLAAAMVSMVSADWVHQAFLIVIAALMVCLQILWARRTAKNADAVRTPWQQLIPATTSLIVWSLYLGLGASVTDVQHYELQTAQCLRSGNGAGARKVGSLSLATSPRLFAMRSYLMATDGHGLANELFAQPIPDDATAETLLLPNDEKQQLLFSPDSLQSKLGGQQRTAGEPALAYLKRCAEQAGHRPGIAADYYLCALLIEHQLDRFAAEVQQFYGHEIRQRSKLPGYYAQALVLYTRRRMHPIIVFRDAAIEANLHDYEDLADKTEPGAARKNKLRRSYGETYWWYFDYHK